MQDLSQLNKKCLSDMPMLLDIMTTIIDQLEVPFSSIYDKIENFLEENLPSKFQLLDDWERGTIYLFSDDYKRRYLEEPIPFMEIKYRLGIEQNLKRSSQKLAVVFGYLCDDGHVCDKSQNVIYFQLFDESEKQFLDSELLDELKQNIPAEWRIDTTEYNSSIWIEFDVDETLSVEKINRCADDFKQYILQPVFDKLNG